MARVLIIDDDQDVTRLLESTLGEEGHVVTIAHQGEEGLAKAFKSPPDLIMLDVFLPDATGFQLCKQLRKNASTQSVPIIMMTGAAKFPNQMGYGFERGANEYIGKPFNIIEIDELIRKYIASEPKEASLTPPDKPRSAGPALIKEDPTILNAFLENALSKAETRPETLVKEPGPTLPFVNPNGKIDLTPFDIPEPLEPAPVRKIAEAPPSPAPKAASARAPFIPKPFDAEGRFFEFGSDVFGLASRLSTTHAEKYLSDQLLRCSLAAGAEIYRLRSSPSQTESAEALHQARKNLDELAYWLMMARKTGSLDKLPPTAIEKTCQDLIVLLNDEVAAA